MTFHEALEHLKDGGMASRRGWNGTGMHIVMVRAAHATIHGRTVPYAPHIAIRTTAGDYIPWTASQADVLASDWQRAT
jgi:hypothetical protein